MSVIKDVLKQQVIGLEKIREVAPGKYVQAAALQGKFLSIYCSLRCSQFRLPRYHLRRGAMLEVLKQLQRSQDARASIKVARTTMDSIAERVSLKFPVLPIRSSRFVEQILCQSAYRRRSRLAVFRLGSRDRRRRRSTHQTESSKVRTSRSREPRTRSSTSARRQRQSCASRVLGSIPPSRLPQDLVVASRHR